MIASLLDTLLDRTVVAAEEGADTIVWLGTATEPGESSGGFWHDRRQRPIHRVPWTKEGRRSVLETSCFSYQVGELRWENPLR